MLRDEPAYRSRAARRSLWGVCRLRCLGSRMPLLDLRIVDCLDRTAWDELKSAWHMRAYLGLGGSWPQHWHK